MSTPGTEMSRVVQYNMSKKSWPDLYSKLLCIGSRRLGRTVYSISPGEITQVLFNAWMHESLGLRSGLRIRMDFTRV